MPHKKFVCDSLNTHLFFSRIMKEHAIFLEAGFLCNNHKLSKIACDFNCKFSDILTEAIHLADEHIDDRTIKSNEICTDFTIQAEEITYCLTNIKIPTKITTLSQEIRTSYKEPSSSIIKQVHRLNYATCDLLKEYIHFKHFVLSEVNKGHLFTTNYPLLIQHIMNEANHYLEDIEDIENGVALTEEEIHEHKVFWSNIMSEHLAFVQGLLDPSEVDLLETVWKTRENYDSLRNKVENNLYKPYTSDLIKETKEIKKFKMAATKGILDHEIKSIIIPLLADHVAREASHFIRILKEYKQKEEELNY